MNKWTPTEDERLARVWPEMGCSCKPLFPGRSLSAIRTRANFLKLKRDGRKRATQASGDSLTFPVTRIEFHDDEPLVKSKFDKRTARGCYGFIPGGPVATVFNLATAIGGNSHE